MQYYHRQTANKKYPDFDIIASKIRYRGARKETSAGKLILFPLTVCPVAAAEKIHNRRNNGIIVRFHPPLKAAGRRLVITLSVWRDDPRWPFHTYRGRSNCSDSVDL